MKKGLKIFGIIIIILIVILAICAVLFYTEYNKSQEPVNTEANSEDIILEIPQGSTTNQISALLEENNVIKNAFMFKVYIKLNNVGSFKAGKYEFENGKEGVKEVCDKLVNGKVYDETVKLTFIEGKTIKDYAKVIEEKTNNSADDVLDLIQDEDYLDSLIEKYWFITDEIKNEDIYYSLEGYILPDTYTFENKDISVEEIFNVIFNYMDKYLTDYEDEIESSNMTVHEILSLASVVELEGKTDEARSGIARVFFNRLNAGMSLGSDVTTYYAFQVNMGESDLTSKQINTENPYNTRGPNMEGKLPVGPICNPSKSAINAVLFPDDNDYYYFVADKNGKVYFSKTYSEHQSTISDLKSSGMWYEY